MSTAADQFAPLPADRSANDLIPAALRFLRVVRRRRRAVIHALTISLSIGALYYVLAARRYESTARLLISQQTQDQIASVGDSQNSDNTMATHRELVTSPVVLEAAIKRLAPAYRIDLVDKAPQAWARSLASRLTAKTIRRTNLIDVSYQSRHPQAAAAVVRAVIESYLEFVRQTYLGTAGELKNVLTEERDKNEQILREKQRALQAFRERGGHLALPPEGVVEPIVQRALKLNDALMECQQRRLELQSAMASVDHALAQGEDIHQHLAGIQESVGQQMMLHALGMSRQDMDVLAAQEKKLLTAQDDLQRLSPFLGPNHPRILELQQQIAALGEYLRSDRTKLGARLDRRQNAEVGAAARGMLQQAFEQAQQRERQLADAFENARNEAALYSGKIVQLRMLEREVDHAQKLHDLLCDKIANIDVRQVQAPLRATVIREPLPASAPVSPQLRLVVVACLAIGSALGGLIVYVQDVVDDRFDSPEAMSSQLGAPVLAMVREFDPLEGEGLAAVYAHAQPNNPATEAFRTLRTALTLQTAASGRLLVSSSEPGDGKTTVTLNLAIVFAQAGKRTLLIDADLRKPGLTTRLELKSSPGVADVLASDRPVEEVAAEYIHHTDAAGLDVLPTGFRRPNPAELLGKPRFAELLAWAESKYDQVLIDCPPVLAVSDAQIVGRLVDGCLLVVRPDANHRRLVMRAVDSFRATGCHVIGIVANGVSAETNGYGYGYGDGYGYGHDEPWSVAEPEESLADEQPPVAMPEVWEVAAQTEDDPAPSTLQATPDVIRPRRAA